MGRLALACACMLLAVGCTKPNELFGLVTDGVIAGATSTDMSSETSAPLYCPDYEPRGEPVEFCELGGLTPIDLGDLFAFAEFCDGELVTLSASRRDADPTILDLCDETCDVCDATYTLNPADPRHQLLLDPAILPPGACARLTHAGTRDADDICTTTRLAVWIDDEPVPRLAAGVDSIAPILGAGLDLRRDDPYTCGCSDADKQATSRYPCCAASTVRYYDLLVTPDGDCPVRVRRGADNRQPIQVRGQPREFTLHDAYEYTTTCAEARQTLFWTMTPGP